MSRKIVLPALVALWAWAGVATAAPDVLDLVPEDAAGAVAIRNLTELHKKGDKFLDETELKVSLRPSQLFDIAFAWLGVTQGLDRNGTAAIIVANPKKAGYKDLSSSAGLDVLVAAVPFTDRDQMASNFGIAAGALKADTMVKGKGTNFGQFFYARGKHVFFGNNEKAVASVAKGKSAGAALSAAQRRRFAGCDILVHFGTEVWGEEWKRFLDQTAGRLKDTEDAAGKVAEELLDSLRTLRFALGGVRIDGGLGVSLLAVFPKDKKSPARKFLSDLTGGPGAASLAGLPDGPAVFAQAGHGDGARNALVARLIVNFLLRDLVETNRLISAADRPTFAGVFTEVWKRLKGRRLAVYRNADEGKQGLFSIAAVLDTADAEGFLKELHQLAHFGGTALDLSEETGRKEDVEAVKKLVRDLGDDAFAVRESATTKLALLGEPALPYVEKALTSGDAEVRRRADRIKRRIVAVAEERRKELLAQALPRPLRPTFTFAPKAETLEGSRVEVLRVKLDGADAALAPRLRQLFGPDWNTVRLAPHGKQVAVLYGSDRKLLATMLKNLKDKRPGLANAKYLTPFSRHSDPGRTAEFHVSVQTVLALLNADDLRKAPAAADHAMTSFALTVGPERLQLDVWVPSAEVKVIAKKHSWW
jgi:hypothetical protein